MHYFRKKSFQNTSASKDHYYLPDEDDKEIGSQISSNQQQQNYQPHQTVVINNFTENAKIKIDILYPDELEVKIKQYNFPNQASKQKNTYSAYPDKTIFSTEEDTNGISIKSVKALEGDYSHPPTPIKTPKYNYNHSFDKTINNSQTPINRFAYHHAYHLDAINKNGVKENNYFDERKSQRYFNTPVVYPIAMSLLKSPEKVASKEDQQNLDTIQTPFPGQNNSVEKSELLRQKRLEVSQRLKNKSLFTEPKEKSFCKVPEFNIYDSMNQSEGKFLNRAESDKPFDQIISAEVSKPEINIQSSNQKPFIVREQISGDYIQDKDELTKKKEEFSLQIKSSGYIESEIAQQVHHNNSFFEKVESKGEIEDLILPKYHLKKIDVQQEEKQHVQLKVLAINEFEQKEDDQQSVIRETQIKNYSQQLQQFKSSANEASANHSITNSQNQISSYRHDLNESHPQLNEVNSLSISKQSYFPQQNNVQQPQKNHELESQDQIGLENQNILSPQDHQCQIQEQEKEQNNISCKIQDSKEIVLITPGKWNRQKSSQSIDIQQYSTRPKSAEAIEIDNLQQNIDYPLNPTPNKITQSRQLWGQEANVGQHDDQPSTVMRLKRDNSNFNKPQDSQDSLDKLSEIQKNSPRDHYDMSSLQNSPQNFEKKPLEEEFHKKYNILIESTNKKSPSSLKFESVISYSISPSPKNIRLNLQSKIQPDQKSLKSSGKAQISLTSSIQISSKSRSRSSSKQTPRTYQQLEKYKKLFKKNNLKPKNPQSPLEKQKSKDRSLIRYSDLYNSQKGYSKKNSMMRNSLFIKVETQNNEEYHHVNDTPKSREKIKSYFEETFEYQDGKRQSNLRKRSICGDDHQQRLLNRKQQAKPKVVKINLKDKKAEDLFTKHKNEFLNKLKHKQKHSKNLLENYRLSSKSNQKPIYAELNTAISHKSRLLSPSLQKLTNRLSSPNPKNYICEHYRKNCRRQLRQKFQSLLEKDDNILLRKYYFSQDELNQIFVEEILNKEINQMYWVQVLVEWGQKKLENMRLRSKSKYHPYEKTVIKQQQLLSDAKRTYANGCFNTTQSSY